ncbi:cytochrome C biogenesis protein CycH [Candidatus Peregrinibacteria bacterium RIFOXYB2_FULL_32_7]|nr:MAG: cytochrome C biogenesis protein CycH [Candidatus Peregrinibacteria bacterium RIFOXYB2_FULL_32_7]
MKEQKLNTGSIVIYEAKDGNLKVNVKFKDETVWLTQKQIAELFNIDRTVITKHVNNIFKTLELNENLVCAIFAHTASDGKVYQTKYYNLDLILSVGYRVNSKEGTQFRIWATNVLKQHLVQGYTLNKKRLDELGQTIKLLKNVIDSKELTSDEATGLLKVITDYSYALEVLDKYDHENLEFKKITKEEIFQITYKEAIKIIKALKEKFGKSNLFGNEKDESFKSSLGAIYQTFDGKYLYESVEERAANLLYLVVKNHSFSDGNKRIAAFLFIWFLERNKILYKKDRSKRIADNALVALTLMIAESKSKEKDLMVKVVVNLINKEN